MTQTLSLGSLATSGGVSRLFGTNSKLDTAALVQAAYEAKRLPALRLENKITQNEARISALGDLRDLLSGLKTAVEGLRNPPGVLGINDNLFEAKEAYLSSNTTTLPTSLIGVTVANGAQAANFDMVVDRVATAHKLKSAATGGAAETLANAWNGGTGFAGTIQLGLAGGTTADIDVDGTMDLYDLAAVINAQSQTTKVGAQVLKVSDAEYRLVLTGTEPGKAVQISDVAGSVSGLLGLTDVQAAQTASFSIDGVALERTSNRIDDVLPGVTFELYKAEPATTVTVSVERSLGTVKTAITDFAAAYNAVRDFITANSSLNAVGEVDEAAVLHGERILRSLSAMLGSEAGRGVAGLASGSPMTLRDLGLTLDASNRLVVDQSKLDQKLLTDFDGVRDVLEFGFSPSNADLRVLSRTNALADTSFLVDIVDADADGIAESVTFDGVAGTVTNGVLEGAAGTAYEGLRMLWAGTGSTSIDVGATQGVADRFYNALDDILNEVDGELQRSVDQYGEANARYRTDIERIEARAEAERDRMIEKMARMEEALARTDALMQQIRAQMDAMNAKQD